MTEKFYEIVAYEENGFASSKWTVCFYKDRQKAKNRCAILNKRDDGLLYRVYGRKFEDYSKTIALKREGEDITLHTTDGDGE